MTATETDDAVARLSRALDQFLDVAARVRPDQAGLPTPCRSFDVRALLGHTRGSMVNFAAAARGEPRPEPAADPAGGDWASGLREAAADLVAAWRQPGALDRPVPLPGGEVPATWRVNQQTAEFAVHAWDLARALGEDSGLDPEIAESSLAWGRDNLRPEYRGDEAEGKGFGPEVPVSADATAYDRLAGFFGRDPAA